MSGTIEHPATLPDFVEAQITQLVSLTGNQREVIVQEYMRVFKSNAAQVAAVLPNLAPEQRLERAQRAAISTAWNGLINMPAVNKYEIMYIGTNGLQVSKGSKRPTTTMFIGLKEGAGLKMYRMTAENKLATAYRMLSPMNIYAASLARRRGPVGGAPGDFVFDSRCTFDNPRPLNFDVYALCQALSVPIVTVEQARANPSKTKSDGFVDPCDWRCILGNFSGPPRVNISKDDAGNNVEFDGQPVNYGRCTVTDMTVKETAYQNEKNFTVYPGIDCYAAPEFLQAQSENDYAAFLGSVRSKRDDKTAKITVSMQCGLIMPIFSMGQGIEER